MRKHADMLLNVVIREVLEHETYGLEVIRADQIAEPGLITNDIVNAILDSELAIADLSFLNPNVFYEIGIRHSAALPIIHMAADGTRLPFDNAPYRTIMFDLSDWDGIIAARESLTAAVDAVLAKDYTPQNPVTNARGQAVLAASSDDRDQILAEMRSELMLVRHSLRDVRDEMDRSKRRRISRQRDDILRDRLAQGITSIPAYTASDKIGRSVIGAAMDQRQAEPDQSTKNVHDSKQREDDDGKK